MTDLIERATEAGQVPITLAGLVGDTEAFFRDHWANQPVVFRSTTDVSGLITEEEMWDEVDCGLLVRPYFTAFDAGVRTALTDMTTKRNIVGHEIPGYINAEQIRKDFEAGGTFKFNQAEHWHSRIRDLVKGLEPEFSGGLEAYVFLSPPGKTAIQAHMDGSHVLVLQVAGVKDWRVGLLDETSVSDSTRYVTEDIPVDKRRDFTLHPGDVLYMPHGTPHCATAREGNSIHIAITIEEPTTTDLSELFLAQMLTDPDYLRLAEEYHLESPQSTVERLRLLLADRLAAMDADKVLAAAVRLKSKHLR